MPRVDLLVEVALTRTPRVAQLETLFDVPPKDKCRLSWQFDFPYDAAPWSVGLIVGPSGSGKSSVLRHSFGDPRRFEWAAPSVIDDFDAKLGISTVIDACQAVGFNTVPAWLRPFRVLSNGEQFRASIARALLESPPDAPIVLDEFTSVVDRQVAKITAHAVQKYVRKNGRQVVCATCHYDVLDWLQPDWVLDMSAGGDFVRRSLQRRPTLEATIARVPGDSWRMFAPFHYLSAARLPGAVHTFALFVEEQPVAIVLYITRPHPRTRDIASISRLVCLPDWQGLGLAPLLLDRTAAAFTARKYRVQGTLAHPMLIKSLLRGGSLRMIEDHRYTPNRRSSKLNAPNYGGRLGCTFRYVGPPDAELADALMPELNDARLRARMGA